MCGQEVVLAVIIYVLHRVNFVLVIVHTSSKDCLIKSYELKGLFNNKV